MAELLRGAPVAASLTEELSYRTRALRSRGIEPTLAIVRVGERSDDLAYERGALKRAERVWHMVTVALRSCSISDTGLPITSERPTTQTREPSSATPERASSSTTASAVQGAKPTASRA